MSVAIIVAIVPNFTIKTFATSKGSASCSAVNHDNMAKVSLNFINANYSTSDTATYIVDRYYYPDMSSFGTVYSATFEGTGMYACSSIVPSGDLSISNKAERYDQLINAYSNTLFSTTDTGTFVGDVPAPGTSVSVSLTANTTSKWNIPGYLNGLAVFQNSPSVTLHAVIIGVDSTALQKEIVRDSALSSSCWTSDTWATFSDALACAKSVASSATALQPDIDAAADALVTARQGLIHNGLISKCEYCLGANNGIEDKKVESLYDVSYGNSNMDVFMPANAEGDVSLIVFIHGGAWMSGDKSEFSSWAYDACAKYGIVAASVNYRYADCFNVTGWGELDDIQNAVAKIKSMAADKGLNVVKMMTAGHSAGGHLSLMYAYTKKDSSPVRPVCVWDMSGPAALYNPEYLNGYGLEIALSAVSGVYFKPEQAQLAYPALLNMSPVNYVNGDTVPTLICHGAIDMVVPYSDSVALNYNLDQAGVVHTFITFPTSNHGLESDPDCHNQMMAEYDRYVRTYLLPGGVPTVVHHYISETVTGASCASAAYTFHSCKDCGKYYITDIQETSHTPGAAATCTEPQTCTVCGSELAPALGHIESEWVELAAATCTLDGLKTKTCSRCNEIYESEAIPAKGHAWNEGEVTTAPNCTEDGVRSFKCTVCGKTKTETEPATGHTPGEAATCTTPQICTVCKAEITPALGHEWSEWTVAKEATVYEAGTKVRTCSRCDAEEEETIAILNGGSSTSEDGVTLSANGAFVTDRCQNKNFKVKVTVTTGGKRGLSYYTLRAVNVSDGTVVATSSTGSDDTTVILGESSSKTWTNTFDTSTWPAGEYRIEARFRYVYFYQNSIIEPWYYNFNTGATTSWAKVSSVKVEDGGHTPGEWTVVTTATSEADGLETISCTVCGELLESRVIPKLDPIDETGIVIADESGILLEEESGILYGFSSEFDFEAIADHISAADKNATIEVVPTQNGYGTGTLINVIKDDDVVESYTVIVFGDATGDAVIDESDFVMIDLYNAMLNMPDEDSPEFKGMDCNRDGVIDESDIVLVDLANAFMGEINQVNGGIIFY